MRRSRIASLIAVWSDLPGTLGEYRHSGRSKSTSRAAGRNPTVGTERLRHRRR